VPKDLAALLAEEGAVSAEALSRAVERRRAEGGALDTALLEDGAIAEDALVALLARLSDLPPAPASAWSADDARARRVFPSRVAERHGLAPFALDGRELSLVATYPVDVGLLEEISFMLSLHLTAHVAPEWRVRELIHRLYAVPLAPRLAALAARAAGGGTAAPDAAPLAPAHDDGLAREGPPRDEIDPRTEPRDGAGARAADGDDRPGPAGDAAPTPSAQHPTADHVEPLEPLAAALAQAIEAVDPGLLEGAGLEEPDTAPLDEDAPLPEPPDRTAPPGWTVADARAALDAARTRDDVVLVALRYARDFFQFAAMFAVTRDAVAGHDALGAEDDARDRCRGVAIYTSDPGIFRTVLDARSPYLGPAARDGAGSIAILDGLGRDAPRTVLVNPVLLRDRPVAVLYADNGEAPVSARRLGDLLLVVSMLGAAFERIIRERKERRTRNAARAPAPAQPPAAEPAAAPPPAEEPWAAREPERASPAAAVAAELPPEAWCASEPARLAAPSAPAEVAPAPVAASSATANDDFELDVDVEEDLGDAFGPTAPGAGGAAAAPAERAPGADPGSPAVLADRALDPDPRTAAAARDALAARRRDPDVRPAVDKLRRALLSGVAARTTGAARALAALRDVEAIPLLIQALETSSGEAAETAADALRAITLQRLGTEARKWLGWWKENRGRGRADWLFSGLTNADRETRVEASIELSGAAPPPVAYSADMPPADREKAARAWAGWWARSGHVI
jgi:hypothetical protein